MASTTNAGDTLDLDSKDTRKDEMRDTIEAWVEDLQADIEAARDSDRLQEFLEFQTAFHDYSWKNTLLIKQQQPDATHVAGFYDWQHTHNRAVKEGASAIWIWAPITVDHRCPKCENNPEYHEKAGCDYDEEPPEEWSSGVVGFRPAPVFDIDQTEPIDASGEQPDLDLSVGAGDVDDPQAFVDAVRAAGATLGATVEIVAGARWNRDGEGVTTFDGSTPTIRVLAQQNKAREAATLIHEIAHAQLHAPDSDAPEREAREAEAEATAYVVGRYFGLEMTRSGDYLGAWVGDGVEVLTDRLHRISDTAMTVIEAVQATHGE